MTRAEASPAVAQKTVPRLALSPDEAAQALGVSRDYLDEHVGGELRWVRRGRRKLVAVAELERWLDAAAARTLDAPVSRTVRGCESPANHRARASRGPVVGEAA
jgi:excisionase family DNA binding protein